jgi:hypothetical protein
MTFLFYILIIYMVMLTDFIKKKIIFGRRVSNTQGWCLSQLVTFAGLLLLTKGGESAIFAFDTQQAAGSEWGITSAVSLGSGV